MATKMKWNCSKIELVAMVFFEPSSDDLARFKSTYLKKDSLYTIIIIFFLNYTYKIGKKISYIRKYVKMIILCLVTAIYNFTA